MRAALCPSNVFVDPIKDLFNLFVEFGPVSDDKHACVRDSFKDRFREPDHREAFSAALCMPDDAAFSASYIFLRGFDPEELVVSADFLDTSVEYDEVVQDVEHSSFVAKLTEFSEQWIIASIRLLPL